MLTAEILKALTAQVEPIRLDAKIRKENTMHTIETGSQVFNTREPAQVLSLSLVNQDQDNTIPACITCGTADIEEIGYDDTPVWQCGNGHRSHEVDEQAIMPEYVLAALAELAADYGPYDFPGDTLRDESGRAA